MSNGGHSLTIAFDGLCAFLPQEPLQIGADKKTNFTVLLMNAGSNMPSSVGTGHRRRERHYAVALFHLQDLAGLTNVPAEARGWWELDHLQLTLNAGLSGVTYSYDPSLRANAVPKEAERSNLAWVPELDEVAPSYGAVKEGWDKPKNPPSEILARMELTIGALEAQNLSVYNRKYVLSEFVPSVGAVPRHVVAGGVAVVISGLTADVKLNGAELRSGGSEGTLVLSTAQRDVRIQVRNLCAGLLMNDAASEPPVQDEDFSWYWELTRRKPAGVLPIPVPVDFSTYDAFEGDAGGNPVRCTPALIEK